VADNRGGTGGHHRLQSDVAIDGRLLACAKKSWGKRHEGIRGHEQ